MRMQQPLNAQSSLNAAKRALGREGQMLEGFVGIGLGANEIRLYVESFETPIVKYMHEHYGHRCRYAGYPIHLIPTPGFRAVSLIV